MYLFPVIYRVTIRAGLGITKGKEKKKQESNAIFRVRFDETVAVTPKVTSYKLPSSFIGSVSEVRLKIKSDTATVQIRHETLTRDFSIGQVSETTTTNEGATMSVINSTVRTSCWHALYVHASGSTICLEGDTEGRERESMSESAHVRRGP